MGLRLSTLAIASGALLLQPSPALAAGGEVLLEFHYQPVAGTQIAIWLEDAQGNFVQDVFVTQATGSLGIGNRPGRWDFLSSWRFPYGPRPQVLPVWAHRRGKTYPKLMFHDDNPADLESLGWHESTSSPESYYCRPLAQEEHDTISTDTMTCPSPAVFQSDKGRFSEDVSYYPPRGDLTSYEDGHDHADVMMFSTLNDLDAVTGATPSGVSPELVTALIPDEVVEAGPLHAFIEVNLEGDVNEDWEFSREDDHFIDPRLAAYGIPWRGQPSVVYEVELEAAEQNFGGTDAYRGYGDELGESGELFPPDSSISTGGGSGADRLQLVTKNDETFRFGVYSHGVGNTPPDPEDPGWGGCQIVELPGMSDIELEPLEFDTVRVHFTLPQVDEDIDLRNVTLFYRSGEMPLGDENASSAIQQVPGDEDCSGDLVPGEAAWCDVTELFGNHAYQIGIRYEDTCSNSSSIVASSVTTPAQEFAQVEGFCFIATAAYGAQWEGKVEILRWFRDAVMRKFWMGATMVDFYYAASPGVASFIERYPFARVPARMALLPLTEAAKRVVGVG